MLRPIVEPIKYDGLIISKQVLKECMMQDGVSGFFKKVLKVCELEMQ